MKLNNIIKMTPVVLAFVLGSCDDYFHPDSSSQLQESEHFQKLSELNSGFLGLAAAFEGVPDHAIIISDLRCDGMEPTVNAPMEFWEVHRLEATNGNSVVAPDLFYKMIINCNDFIRHAIDFNKENTGVANENILRGMIAEALRFRAWSYLTIGKIYGKAYYYDYAMSDMNDMSGVPVLELTELVDVLISNLEHGVEGYDGLATMDWNELTYTESTALNRLGINVNAIMGELYMWKGDYKAALIWLLKIVNNTNIQQYTCAAYADNKYEKWRDIYAGSVANATNEFITAVNYMVNQRQQSVLQYYFSKESPNVYYLKPSNYLIRLYQAQELNNGSVGDRWRGSTGTYTSDGGDFVVNKYSRERTAYAHDAPVSVYRAGGIHLMIAECLNHLTRYEEALTFVNDGPKAYWNSGGYFLFPFSDPIYTTNLKESAGVRGRINLKNYPMPGGTDEEKTVAIDSLIADEMGMECAFEGQRLFTLLRMARNNNRPEFMANGISRKFTDLTEREKYRSMLMSPANWFVPYDQLKK